MRCLIFSIVSLLFISTVQGLPAAGLLRRQTSRAKPDKNQPGVTIPLNNLAFGAGFGASVGLWTYLKEGPFRTPDDIRKQFDNAEDFDKAVQCIYKGLAPTPQLYETYFYDTQKLDRRMKQIITTLMHDCVAQVKKQRKAERTGEASTARRFFTKPQKEADAEESQGKHDRSILKFASNAGSRLQTAWQAATRGSSTAAGPATGAQIMRPAANPAAAFAAF